MGNAKLYYSRSVQEQKLINESMRMKERSKAFSKEKRLARMEEKSSISRMLNHKIAEIESSLSLDGVEVDSTLDDYSFLQEGDGGSIGDVSDIDKDLDIFRDFAYNALRSKKLRYLDALANKVNTDQFREVLYVFGINSKESLELLTAKYSAATAGVIDAKTFKRDFKSIANNENQRRKQKGAVSSFFKAVARKDSDLQREKSQIVIQTSQYGDRYLDKEGMRARNESLEDIEKQTTRIIESQKHLEAKTESEITEIQKSLRRQAKLDAEAIDEGGGEFAHEKDIDEATLLQIIGDGQADSLNKNLSEAVLRAEDGHDENGDYEDSYGSDDYEDFEIEGDDVDD